LESRFDSWWGHNITSSSGAGHPAWFGTRIISQVRILPTRPTYNEIKDHYEGLPDDNWLIITDAAGLRSKEVAIFLKEKGFMNILHLAGGVVEWERDGLPVILNKKNRFTGARMCQLRRREK
jgi:rhodanese-related sulfurtransferase